MKKIIYSAMAVAMLATTSCKDDFAESFVGDQATVEFSISTPEIGTRYGEGTTATNLQYAVYEVQGEGVNKKLSYLDKLTVTDATINGSTTVKLDLTTGETYAVIFWAAAPGAPYTVDFEDMEMTVDYNGAKSNDESRDAFYKYHTFTVSGAQTENIELKRPFAQLNIGTEDYQKAAYAGYTPNYSYVKVPVSSTLNLKDGSVGQASPITFGVAPIKKDETFPVAGNQYISMNYLLVPADKGLVDVEFGYSETVDGKAKTRTISNVPVQRNYRTNIYGKLLTSEVDVNVEIKPEYNEEDYLIYNVVVDGTSYGDFATAAAKAMELNKPIELIQNVTIDADNTIIVPAGKTLTLNLNGYTLKGVSDQTGSNRNIFDVRGEMTVDGANSMTRGAAVGNGVIAITHKGTNMGWGSSTNVFNVTAGGVLNIRNTNAINFGGSDMAFVAHLNNWGEVTLNVENSTLESNYVAVRVFNSGYDMNNVTINNSTLKGGNYAFWVHNYTAADFGTQEKADAQKALLNFDIFNGTNTFEGKNDTPIRYGFTDAIYLEASGLRYENKTYYIPSANALVALSNKKIEKDEKVVLTADIDLAGIEFNGLSAFNPENNNTFDGQDYTVSNWTNNSGASDMGFIKNWVGPIKNINFVNCHLKTAGRSAIVAAKVYGNIENVHVTDCSIEDSYWACGLIAGLYNNGSVENCSATNSSVKSNGGTAAIVGVVNESAGTRSFTNCKVVGCTINNTGAYGKAYSGALLCGMINITNSTVKFIGCKQKDNTKLGKYVGDLYYAADEDITIVVE